MDVRREGDEDRWMYRAEGKDARTRLKWRVDGCGMPGTILVCMSEGVEEWEQK